MANGFYGFDPVGTRLKVQQIKRAQQEEQLRNMQIAQAQQDTAKTQAFNRYVSGEQRRPNAFTTALQGPQSAQAPPMQPPPGEQQAAQKTQLLQQSINKEMQSEKPNAAKIRKYGEIAQKSPEIQSYIKDKLGFDRVEPGYDEKTKEAWVKYTKDYTRDDLDKFSELPGGQALKGLPPGKYTLNYDPINGSIRPVIKDAGTEASDWFADQNMTENEIIARAVSGDANAIKWMDAKLAFEGKKAESRGGTLSPEAIEFLGRQMNITGKMPSVGRGGKNRTKIADAAAEIAKKEGLTPVDLSVGRGKIGAAQTSYNKQKIKYDADEKNVLEFKENVKRAKEMIPLVQTNYPSLVNKSLKQVRTMAADPMLGQQAVLAQELYDLMNQYIRVTLDASDSVAELSQGAQKARDTLFNINNPVRVLIDQVNAMENSLDKRLGARKAKLDKTSREVERYTKFKKDKKPEETKAPKTMKVGRFQIEVE